MDPNNTEQKLGPSQEGSEPALQVLSMMNNWRSPISIGELSAITSIEADTLRLVLKGLQTRGRVVCDGRGTAARWQLAHLAKAGL